MNKVNIVKLLGKVYELQQLDKEKQALIRDIEHIVSNKDATLYNLIEHGGVRYGYSCRDEPKR